MTDKKLPKPDRDNYQPVLLVVRTSQVVRWSECAREYGMTLTEWVSDRLDRIAPERT
jgi:hypothetical protein